MPDVTLQAQRRTLTGKKVGRLRRQGLIPGNIYGRGIESIAVQLEVRALSAALAHAGNTTVVDLHVASNGSDGAGGSAGHPVLIEHITRHPVTGHVLHVDLRQVDLNRVIRAAVPVTLVGEAPAVESAGGVLVHPMDSIELEALPRSLPHEILVDVSVLTEIDAQITVADLQLPPGVTAGADPETLVARVVASRLEQEVAAEEAVTAESVAEEQAAAGEPADRDQPSGERSSEAAS